MIPVKNIWINEHHDTDWDGVPNYRDCQPLNPYQQHSRPSETMQKRLMKLNIYVTKDPPTRYKKYRLTSKEAKKHAHQAVKEFYEKIKWHPGIVGEMERNSHLGYIYSSFTSKIYPLGHYNVDRKKIFTIKQASHSINEKEKAKRNTWFDDQLRIQHNLRREHLETIKRTPYSSEGVSTVSKKQKRRGVETFFHEMGHYHHSKEIGFDEYKKLPTKEQEYFFRPSEIRARRYATKKLKEREKKRQVSPKSYKKILRLY